MLVLPTIPHVIFMFHCQTWNRSLLKQTEKTRAVYVKLFNCNTCTCLYRSAKFHRIRYAYSINRSHRKFHNLYVKRQHRPCSFVRLCNICLPITASYRGHAGLDCIDLYGLQSTLLKNNVKCHHIINEVSQWCEFMAVVFILRRKTESFCKST